MVHFPEMIYLAPLPIFTGILFLWLWRQSFILPKADDQHSLRPFLILSLIFALGFAGLAYSFYPYVVPDRLTIWQAASATKASASSSPGPSSCCRSSSDTPSMPTGSSAGRRPI